MDFKQWFYEVAQTMPLDQALKAFGLRSLEGVTKGTLDAQYRKLVKQHHPDVGGDIAQFKNIQSAFEALTMSMQQPQTQAQPQSIWGTIGKNLKWGAGQFGRDLYAQAQKTWGPGVGDYPRHQYYPQQSYTQRYG